METLSVTMLEAAAAAIRWMLFTGIVTAVGIASYRFVQLRPLGALSERFDGYCAAADRMARTFAFRVALFLVLPGAALRLGPQFALFRDPYEEAVLPQLDLLVSATGWGLVWRLQLGAAAALVVAGLLLRLRSSTGRWGLYAILAGFLAFTPALSGHASGSEQWRIAAVVADGLHVVAAGGWIGGLALMVLGFVRFRSECDGTGAVPIQVGLFSPTALVWVAALLATGVFSSWLHVPGWGQLLGSGYGRLLLLKVGLVLPTLALGALHWRRIKPALADGSSDRAAFVRSATVELCLAWIVLLVTAVLVATSLPGEG